MAGQRVQIKATHHCSASVTRFTRHWGTSPLTALVIHFKGNRRCKSPPLRTYTFTQLSPQSLDLDIREADVLNEKGHKDEQQGRRGHLGESGMVGVGGRGMTQEAEPFSFLNARIKKISLVSIAFWPSGAPPGSFPWDRRWRRRVLRVHGQLGGLCTSSRSVRCCAPHTGQSLLPTAGLEVQQHQNHWWLQVTTAKVRYKVPTQCGTWRPRNS